MRKRSCKNFLRSEVSASCEECPNSMLCISLNGSFCDKEYRVVSLGKCRKIRNKLNGMGLYKDSVIRVLKNDAHYPIKIAVSNVRIAIGREIASKILVTNLEKDE